MFKQMLQLLAIGCLPFAALDPCFQFTENRDARSQADAGATSLIKPLAKSGNGVDGSAEMIRIQQHSGHYFNPISRRRSEEHTSELQSRQYLVCRLLLEKKNEKIIHEQI